MRRPKRLSRGLGFGLTSAATAFTRESESAAIEAVGFEIEEIDGFGFAAQRFEPSTPHILGRA